MEFISRGVQIHYRRWWVEGALGIVVVSHGLGEHSGRYRALARYLNEQGFSVYALDHYGHGQSEGVRGDIEDFAQYSEDLHHFIRLVKRDNPEKRVHLLGHSMGGVIACGCAMRHGDIDSLILSAPGFRGRKEPGSLERWLVHRLVRLLPRLTLPNRVAPNLLSRDESVVADYRADDLVHGRVSLQWFEAYLRERDYLYPRLAQIAAPCLLLLPEGDQIVDPVTTRAWFERFGSGVKSLQVFADAYHEVLNEVEEGPVARNLVIQYLKSLLPIPEATPSG